MTVGPLASGRAAAARPAAAVVAMKSRRLMRVAMMDSPPSLKLWRGKPRLLSLFAFEPFRL
jgi:hypothetical protein